MNMSGKFNGCAAHIIAHNILALYFHCQGHKLNLSVMSSCEIQEVKTMMNHVQAVKTFFKSPKKLKDACRTRWVERIDSLEVFMAKYSAVLDALALIFKNEVGTQGYPWLDAAVGNAERTALSIRTFRFIIILVIVEGLMSYLKSLIIRIQGRGIDIAYKRIQKLFYV